MADQIVSVRMPSSLVEELKALADKNHYLDVSEEIRSLLREKWLTHKDPYSLKLMAIKEIASKSMMPTKIESLRSDLKRLLEEIDGLR